MIILSNKDFKSYKTTHNSWHTLDGTELIPISVLDNIKGYIDHIRNTGMGKKKSLEYIEKFIEGLKAESEEDNGRKENDI